MMMNNEIFNNFIEVLSKMLQKKNETLQKESLVIKDCTGLYDIENTTKEKWDATKEVYNTVELLIKNDIKSSVCDIKKMLCYKKSYGFILKKNDIKSETHDIKKKGYLLFKMLQKKNETLESGEMINYEISRC